MSTPGTPTIARGILARGSADLHARSPRIFLICLACSCAVTAAFLLSPLPAGRRQEITREPPPVIITLQNIPETFQTVARPASPKPFIPSAAPVPTDAPAPEATTVPDTKLDRNAAPEAPPALIVPERSGPPPSAAAVEKEVYEFFSVEEPPKPLVTVSPEYPEMAKRAGIQGIVYLKVLVNRAGRVDSVEVQKGPEIFLKPAVAAAKQTTFKSARQNDRPVACWVVIPFRFVLKKE